MPQKYYQKLALKRLRFSLFIILVYLLGSNLSMPGVNTKIFMDMMNQAPNLSFVLSMTGLSLERFSLFSIGLGPWMSALILWRVLGTTKIFNLQSLTSGQSFRIKFLLSLSIGVIQALGILSQMEPLGPGSRVSTWMLVAFMVTGLAVIIWLGNMNKQYGFGGPTIIILINILREWPQKIAQQLSTMKFTPVTILILVGAVCAIFFLLFLVLRFYQGERRLPLMHVMLDGTYSSDSYIPISTNPAGGMPYMYSFSVVLFPQYFLMLLGGAKSKFEIVRQIYTQIQMDHLGGVLLLVASVVFLTYGFAYVNVDYKELAENLRNSGDYFHNVYPGKNTEKYLFDKVTIMATVAATFNAIMLGLPMLLSLFFKNMGVWAQLTPTLMILLILMREIYIQFRAAYHRNDYPHFVQSERLYE